jgi:hypothetical protein
MKPLAVAAGLAALAGLALAQDPPAPTGPAPVVAPAPVPRPPVVTVESPPEVVVRGRTPGTNSTVVVGSGNGWGNSVVIDGTPGASTVVQNSRNGFGNRVVINGIDVLADLPFGELTAAMTPPPVYRGRATRFWAERAWSEADDCNVYWSAADGKWFRYHRADDSYRVLAGDPLPPPAVR